MCYQENKRTIGDVGMARKIYIKKFFESTRFKQSLQAWRNGTDRSFQNKNALLKAYHRGISGAQFLTQDSINYIRENISSKGVMPEKFNGAAAAILKGK